MADNGIRTVNLQMSDGPAVEVLAHIDMGNGIRVLRRQPLGVFVQRLLGLANLDASGIADLTDRLQAEITRATTADDDLGKRISSEIERLTGAGSDVADKLAAEIVRAKRAESDEAKARADADIALSETIAAEVAARQNAITAEVTARQNAVTAEAQARAQGDADLGAGVQEANSNAGAALANTASLTAFQTATVTTFVSDELIAPAAVDAAGNFVDDVGSVDRLTRNVQPGAYLSDDYVGPLVMTPDGAVIQGQRRDGAFQVGIAPAADWDAFSSGSVGSRQVFAYSTGLPPLAISTGENPGDNVNGRMLDAGWVGWTNINGSQVTLLKTRLLGGAATLAASVTNILILIGKGQSNTAGSASGSVLTATPPAPGYVLMWDNGSPRVLQHDHGPTRSFERVHAMHLENIVNAKEMLHATSGESIMTMAGYEAQKRLGNTWGVVVANVAIGSQPYDKIKKGTPPYNNLLEIVRRTRIVMGVRGRVNVTVGVLWSGQEAEVNRTLASYSGMVLEDQANLTSDINAITGGTSQVLLVVDGLSNFTKYIGPQDGSLVTAQAPLGALDAAINNPTKVVYACPTYLFATAPDGVHKLAVGAAHEGAYMGRAIARALLGQDALPVYPTAASYSGGLVTATMRVLAGNALSLSSPYVANTADGFYGLTVARQDTGALVPISAVSLAAANQVRATLSSPPSGVPCWLYFGGYGPSGANAGPTTGARCPINDGSSETSFYGRSLANHAAISRIAFTPS